MRLIDADALIAEYCEGCKMLEECKTDPICATLMWIVEAPTIEAEPVRHGRWIHDINNLYGCSECMEREAMSPKKLKNYCPNCGAKMDRGAKCAADCTDL